MAERIALLRALVLLSSLAVLLLMLVLIGSISATTKPYVEEASLICGTRTNVDSQGNAMSELQLTGKALFKQNCATCHNRNMVDDMTGPALAGVTERWAAYDQADLYSWIRNSIALVDAKHPRAVEIYKQWGNSNMTSFPTLTDKDIEGIIAYIER